MSRTAFQSALARLVMDPEFARQVRSGAALPVGLSPLERRRLAGIAAAPGLAMTRTLHRGFRLNKLLGRLPLTVAVLPPALLSREIQRFWRERLPTSFYYLEEAIACCDFLLRRAREGLGAPYLEEVVAFERAGLLLELPGAADAERSETVAFRHDPAVLLLTLQAGRRPRHVPRRPCRLIGGRGRDGRVHWGEAGGPSESGRGSGAGTPAARPGAADRNGPARPQKEAGARRRAASRLRK